MDKFDERLMKLFEEASSGSTIPDPFSDDGQCGSDGDYNPDDDKVSTDSSATPERTRKRSKSCNTSNRSQPANTAPLRNRTVSSSSLSSSGSSSSPSHDLDKTESLPTDNDDYQDISHMSVNENVPRSPNGSITSCESMLSESLLQSNTTQPIEEEQDPNFSSNIMQDPEPGPSNVPQRHIRPVTPAATENWEQTTSDIPEFNFNSTSTGVQFQIDENTSVLDTFRHLFPSHIVSQLVEHTNQYGKALCNKNRPMTRNSRRYSFREIDEDELLKFLGLCLLQGQISVPKKRKLFTYSDLLYYHPIFPYSMSHRRFEQILRCLCASDLNAKGSAKVDGFIDSMCKIFQNCYKPEKELSLDESLLLFRGRLKFRQYIKGKKARYGIKFYELTTADGFVLNILMYAGKTDDLADKGKKTEKLVLRLMRPYLMKGHHLFMDNYYNSVALSEKLLGLKTHSNGTLRSNRKGNPKTVVAKKIKKGQHVWARKHKVYVSKWVDKRPVLMVTTLNHPKIVNDENRYGISKLKPLEVSIYNKYMSGIDRSDQMVSYYSSPSKTIRWYKKVIFHILDIAVWNSFYIYKKYHKANAKSYEFLHFREELILKLIKLDPNLKPENLIKHHKYDNRKNIRKESMPSSSTRDTSISTGHWPEKIPKKDPSQKKSVFFKCKMCTKNKIRRESSYRCKGCPDKPALCPSCFEEWHNQSPAV